MKRREDIDGDDDPARTPEYAARYLGLSKKTLANHRVLRTGCPFVKMPGRNGRGAVRYPMSDLVHFRNSLRRTSTSSTA